MSGFDFSAHQKARCEADPSLMKRAAAPRVGVPLTTTTRIKISDKLRARYQDPEERAKQSQRSSRGGVPMPEEERERRRVAQAGKPKSAAASFHVAAARLGFDPKLMAAVHADLASLALVHGITLDELRRMAKSPTLLTAEPRERALMQPLPLPIAPPKPAARPTERPCLRCERPIPYDRVIRMCTECKARG